MGDFPNVYRDPVGVAGGMAKSILQPSSSDAISIAVHDFCLQSPFWD